MSKTIITFWRLWVGKLPSLLLLVTSRLPSRGVELLVPVAVLHAFDSTAGAETLYNNAHHPRFHTVTADWQGTESVTGHPLLYSHGATARCRPGCNLPSHASAACYAGFSTRTESSSKFCRIV
jgi:hypothetical protein